MFATREETEVLKTRYGADKQRAKACEELAELSAVVAAKIGGIRPVNNEHYKEELADAYNMLEQLRYIEGFSMDEIKAIARKKMEKAVAEAGSKRPDKQKQAGTVWVRVRPLVACKGCCR